MGDRKNLLRGIGILALGLLLALLTAARVQDRSAPEKEEKGQEISLTFSPEILTYDGKGELDLLTGVRAEGADGTDLSDNVEAVLT